MTRPTMKKLILYSDQIPELRNSADNELKNLFSNSNPRIGYIPSSSDPERKYYHDRKAFYDQIGMDLGVYFELDVDWKPGQLGRLLECDAIHLSGGNTYYFLHWLRLRNIMDLLVQYVTRGGILIGVSAGSILMTPDISTSSICGDEQIQGETDFSGLGLVDFAFVPHFGNRSFTIDDLKKYSREKQRVVYAARDTGAIIVIDNEVKCIGDVIRVG
ncbi:MAG: Type 1 glutamine amidotransferase-like domain-containing protein [Dehalococcoidales bacterium]